MRSRPVRRGSAEENKYPYFLLLSLFPAVLSPAPTPSLSFVPYAVGAFHPKRDLGGVDALSDGDDAAPRARRFGAQGQSRSHRPGFNGGNQKTSPGGGKGEGEGAFKEGRQQASRPSVLIQASAFSSDAWVVEHAIGTNPQVLKGFMRARFKNTVKAIQQRQAAR